VSWGWLLTALGYRMFQDWPGGRSWRSGSAYIVVEQSPARTASRHDRCRPGLNHLAFHVETRRQVDELTAEALLHGWKLADVTFYTTEVPQYALIELAHGLSQGVVHIAAAMTYTLVLLFAALLAKGTATGREAAARVAIGVGIMLAPQLASGTNELLSSPDHIGTSVPLLLILLIIDRVQRPRWWVPVLVAALVAWADLADSIVLLAAVIPLVLVCVFRVARSWRRPAARWYEIALALGALAGFGLAQVAYRIIRAAGGYTTRPLGFQLAPLSEIFGHNLPIAAQGLLLLPGADFLGLPAGASTLFVALHLVGVAAAAAGIALALWRFCRRDADFVNQLLLTGIVVNFIAFVVTTHVVNVASAREIAPALPFAAVLAGRLLAGRLISARLVPVAAAVLLGYVLTLGSNALARPAPSEDPRLASFLAGHHLRYGLSGYWQADALTLASGNRVQIRALGVNPGSVSASHWESDASWYDPRLRDANFVLLFSGKPGFTGEAGLRPFEPTRQIEATFGRPERTYDLGRYTVLVWRQNLLRRLS